MHTKEFVRLLEKFASGQLSAAEHDAFFEAVRSGRYDDVLTNHIEVQFHSDITHLPGLPPYRSEALLRKIMTAEKETTKLMPRRVTPARWLWSGAAAAVLIAVALPFLYKPKPRKELFQNPISGATHAGMEQRSAAKQALTLSLADGSTVVLKLGSTLRYPQAFSPEKREVYLEGEAFFDVAKRNSQPFFVYNKNIVTQVLGTSFTVKADPEKHELEVAVHSGRVQVYEQGNSTKRRDKESNGVLLLPNQKVVYEEESHRFVASLVDMPLPIKQEKAGAEEPKEIYEETALATVLPVLQARYGVLIVAENEAIYDCLFTGDISQQNLYTKLDIICKTLNASYEVVGTKILIRGAGCH